MNQFIISKVTETDMDQTGTLGPFNHFHLSLLNY